MNAVGIDVSKGKSMVAVVSLSKQVLVKPREFAHTDLGLEQLIDILRTLEGETRVIMEATGRYHEIVAQELYDNGYFVCVVNPIVVHGYGNNSVRRVSTDKKDALKIARYGVDNWNELREHTPTDSARQLLKLFNRQYNLYMKVLVSLQNNLIALLDKTFPGANELFTSPRRSDGSHKWVDFIQVFWHSECIRNTSLEKFTERYQKWCKRKGYNFSEDKALDVYVHAACCGYTLPKNAAAKALITTACNQVIEAARNVAAIKAELMRISAQMPEYEVVMGMYGVGDITAAQLMAEIGDVRRFDNRNSIVAFAGVDPSAKQSGKYEAKSGKTSKRGSASLRKTLFCIVRTHLMRSPIDEPVFQFLDLKRREGKHFYVYMTAAANKFLRIYYAKVKACFAPVSIG
jgi:transposase